MSSVAGLLEKEEDDDEGGDDVEAGEREEDGVVLKAVWKNVSRGNPTRAAFTDWLFWQSNKKRKTIIVLYNFETKTLYIYDSFTRETANRWLFQYNTTRRCCDCLLVKGQ